MLTDIYAHRFADDPKSIENTVEDYDFDQAAIEAEWAAMAEAGAVNALDDADDWEDLNSGD